jgi:hypothetical protein
MPHASLGEDALRLEFRHFMIELDTRQKCSEDIFRALGFQTGAIEGPIRR